MTQREAGTHDLQNTNSFSHRAIHFCHRSWAGSPNDCLSSIPIQSGKVTYDGATHSCASLEDRRAKVFSQMVTYLKTPDNAAAIAAARQSVAEFEAELKRAKDKDSPAGLTKAVIENFIATVGLTTCFGPQAIACAGAAALAIWAKIDLINEAKSLSGAQKSVEFLERKLAEAKTVLANASQIRRNKNVLVDEFTAMCRAIQQDCTNSNN